MKFANFCAQSVAVLLSFASTITRTSDSVPEGRTSTDRPRQFTFRPSNQLCQFRRRHDRILLRFVFYSDVDQHLRIPLADRRQL